MAQPVTPTKYKVTVKRVETETKVLVVDATFLFEAKEKALAAVNHNKVSLDVTMERYLRANSGWSIEAIERNVDPHEH